MKIMMNNTKTYYLVGCCPSFILKADFQAILYGPHQ